ncbi:glycoprotein [Hemipteran phasma-related virus OKIAV247]|uniref:Glycoprotein n=1 Tax=Hemipteran phasma-related virus OKIAV247 TaxID=2746303 RepID=A0A7D7JJ21_9VIRU|nr:glycoprotein [Hemipteran phasma-related virus OKIAV247]QMP82393.1 glycoprotein [Hemipteran phasma-related virus OKIAV247]
MEAVWMLALFSLAHGQYLRELFDYGDKLSYINVNKLASFEQKTKEVINVLPESCDETGCHVKLSHTFNMIVDKGYGVSFGLEHAGIVNSSLQFTIENAYYNLSTEYMYTTPMAKVYYRLAFQNYDSQKYSDCVNNVGVEGFATSSDVQLSGTKDVDWAVAYRKSKTYSLGPYSSESISCGHYWPTTLTTCIEKAVIIRKDKGVMLYKLSDDIDLDFNIIANVNGAESIYRFSGDFNQPQQWVINSELTLEVNPVGTVVNPERMYMACLYKKTTSNLDYTCYKADSPPGKGVIPAAGLGKFQLVNLEDPTSIAFDKSQLSKEMIYSCNSVNKFTGKLKRGADIGLANDVHKIFDLDNSENLESTISIDYFVKDKPMGLKLGDTCCTKIDSPTDQFLEKVVDSYFQMDEAYKSKMVLPVAGIALTGSYPSQPIVSFRKLVRKPISVSLLSDGFTMVYDKKSFEIRNLKITTMVYYQGGAGSHFKLSFDFIGTPQNIKIESSHITLLTKELYVKKSGKYEDLIGFKNVGYLSKSPTICVGSSDNCVKPDHIDEKDPKDSVIDDNDDFDGNQMDKVLDLLHILFLNNWALSVLSFLILMVNVILMLVIFIMIAKLTRKFFTVLLCASMMKESTAFVTPNKGPLLGVTEFKTMYIYRFLTNPETRYKVDVNPAIEELINRVYNDKASRILQCMEFDPAIMVRSACEDHNCYTGRVIERNFTSNKDTLVTFYSSEVVGVEHGDSSRETFIKQVKDLYVNTTTSNNNCVQTWKKFIKFPKTYIRETVPHNYKPDFGLSTTKLAYISEDMKTGVVFEFIDSMTFYDEMDIIEIKEFGRDSAKHAISVGLVTDAGMLDELIVEYIKEQLVAPGGIIITTANRLKSRLITKLTYLIQCESPCRLKNPLNKKEILISKYFPIHNFDELAKLLNDEIAGTCKKESEVFLSKSLTLNGSSSVTIGTNALKKYIGLGCVNKGSTRSMVMDGVLVKDVIVTNDGIFDVTVGKGPLGLECHSTGIGLVCRHPSSNMLALITSGGSEFTSRSINYAGIKMNYLLDFSIVRMQPVLNSCKGSLFVDQNSKIQCSHDCCLTSKDNWLSFSVINAGDSYSMKGGKVLTQWQGDKNKILNYKGSSWCEYSGFTNSVKCLFEQYETTAIILLLLPIIVFLIYLGFLTLYSGILYCFSKNSKRDVGYLIRKRYKKRWFVQDMADNLSQGNLKFWARKIEDDSRELMTMGRNNKYSRRVKLVKPAV